MYTFTYIRLLATDWGGCKTDFFGLPVWYKYLKPKPNTSCTPDFTSLQDTWLVAAAVLEMLLRLSALVAMLFVLIGGIKYIMSNGQPDKASQARSTIINGLIGLAIAIAATAIVSFVAGKFQTS